MRRRIMATCAAGAAALIGCGGGSMHTEHASGSAAGSRAAPAERTQGASAPSFARDTARLRVATAAFRSMEGAAAAGYPITPVPGCIAHPTLGGMGHHLTNEKLLDATIEVERPEVLVYRRTPGGGYELTGVEYMVPFSAHPPEKSPPTVMGQELKPFARGKFWYRHVWIWLDNPAGLFEDWNPKVACT
jgi:hypothetical protein